MRRSTFPEGVEIHSPDLTFESEAQATEILRRSWDFHTPGVKNRLVVTANTADGTRVDITAGDGYTGDADLATKDDTYLFEYVQLASGITGQVLADYGVGVNNYFSLLYLEATDPNVTKPQPHECDGRAYETRAIPRTDAGILEVVNQTTFDSYYDVELQRRLVFAIVTARGVGTPLSSVDIELPRDYSPAIYDVDVRRATAVDGFHRSLVGTGTPGYNNAHGLTLGDLGGEVAFVTVGDGILSNGDYTGTDTSIQDAIDAVRTHSWKGGTIFIKKGDYSPTDTIILYSNIYLMGEGRATKINRPVANHLFTAVGNVGSANGVKGVGSPVFVDLGAPFNADMVGDYIWMNDGDADDGSYEIISVTSATTVVLDRDMTAINNNTTYEVHRAKIVIENIYLTGLGELGNFDLVNWDYAEECFIRGCWIMDNTRYGIYVDHSDKLVFSENIIRNHTNSGIYLFSSDYCIVSNNISERNDDGIRLNNCLRCAIEKNICNYNSTYGILLEETINTCDQCSIIGNECNYNRTGIHLSLNGTDSVQRNNVSGNVCCYNTGNDANTLAGIYVRGGGASRNVVNGNTCCYNTNAGGGTGYGIRCTAGPISNCIMGNICNSNDTNFNVSLDDGCDATRLFRNWAGPIATTAADFNQTQ